MTNGSLRRVWECVFRGIAKGLEDHPEMAPENGKHMILGLAIATDQIRRLRAEETTLAAMKKKRQETA